MIDPKDVIESYVRSSGPGGQNVNKTSTCVVLLHCPTGIRVKCQQTRSQYVNREKAWLLLEQKVSESIQAALQKERDRKEKIRRQKKKRTVSSKERMLKDKKHRSTQKLQRSKWKGQIDEG